MADNSPLLAPLSPGGTALYGVVLDQDLMPGESIVSEAWTVSAGLSILDTYAPSTFSDSGGRSSQHVRLVKVTGGKLGAVYQARLTVTYNSANFGERSESYSFRIPCLET